MNGSQGGAVPKHEERRQERQFEVVVTEAVLLVGTLLTLDFYQFAPAYDLDTLDRYQPRY